MGKEDNGEDKDDCSTCSTSSIPQKLGPGPVQCHAWSADRNTVALALSDREVGQQENSPAPSPAGGPVHQGGPGAIAGEG